MKKIFRNNRGGAAVEFALVALPVLVFIFGIMQTAWIVWVDNLLQVSVTAAARCGGIGSTTPPCGGKTTADMIATANQVFGPINGVTFIANGSSCVADGGTGLVGTYQITFLFVINLTVTAKSCYPTMS